MVVNPKDTLSYVEKADLTSGLSRAMSSRLSSTLWKPFLIWVCTKHETLKHDHQVKALLYPKVTLPHLGLQIKKV